MKLSTITATAAAAVACLIALPKHAVAEPLAAGTTAPDFSLPDQHGKIHRLDQSHGKTVVLAFYPADMTPGCTLEAHSLTAALPEFEKRHIVLYAISVQNVKSKQKFCAMDHLKHTLLSDVGGKVCKEYGVLAPSGLAQRVTFIVGPNGKIEHVIDHVDVHNHGQQVLDLIPAKKNGKSHHA